MDASEIAAFRDKFRQNLIERIALQTAFVTRLSILGLSAKEGSDHLKHWLDEQSTAVDRLFGAHFGDPALSALYADEVKEIIDEMKAFVDKMEADAVGLLRNRK